mmetsp:Transcript_530/g.1245  ORF Transcript_530/g.1245 Transcript_530/m.1245 type:complete len:90 (-) Transcript_530:661-930(-)
MSMNLSLSTPLTHTPISSIKSSDLILVLPSRQKNCSSVIQWTNISYKGRHIIKRLSSEQELMENSKAEIIFLTPRKSMPNENRASNSNF